VPLFSSRFQALLAFMRVIRRTQRPLPNGIADLEKLGIQSRRRGAGVRTQAFTTAFFNESDGPKFPQKM
jgi:hypothetical protein